MRRPTYIVLSVALLISVCVQIAVADGDNDPSYSAVIDRLIGNYTHSLGTRRSNAFHLIDDPTRGQRIYRSLSYRRERHGTKVVDTLTPLGRINLALQRHVLSAQVPFEAETVDALIEDAMDNLREINSGDTSDSSVRRAQSNVLGLYLAKSYLRRFAIDDAAVDRDGDRYPEQTHDKPRQDPQEQDPDQQQETQQQRAEAPPRWPQLPQSYQASTKDASSSSGQQEKSILAIVDKKVPFFGGRIFADVTRRMNNSGQFGLYFEESTIPIPPPPPGQFSRTKHAMTVMPLDQLTIDLPMPPGMRPLQPDDLNAVVVAMNHGGYQLRLKQQQLEVVIPLVDEVEQPMMPHLHEIFTRPVGVAQDEWPDRLRRTLINKYAPDQPHNPLTIAQAVADHLATDYLYSVGERPETDLIDALNCGAFQCDMASGIAVAVLRDVYGIPARIRGGFRAKHKKGGSAGKSAKTSIEASYLITPDQAHAWFEVYANGRWHLFDATPVNKDRKEDQQSGKDEFGNNKLENTPEPEPEPEPEDQGGGDDNSDHDTSADDQTDDNTDQSAAETARQVVDRATKKRLQQLDDEDETDDDAEARTDDDHTAEGELDFSDELIDQLEIGSLSLDPSIPPIGNPLKDRVIRSAVRHAINPQQSGNQITTQLSYLDSAIRHSRSTELRELVRWVAQLHKADHPPIEDWVRRVRHNAERVDVTETYFELHQLIGALTEYAKLLDPNDLVRPQALLSHLNRAKRALQTLAPQDAEALALIDDLSRKLPPLARRALHDKYGITHVGDNTATRAAVQDFTAGRLSDLRLLAEVYDLTDFILNSTDRPEYMTIKTWTPTTQRSSRDLLPMRRLSDLRFGPILGNPGKDLIANMMDGTAWVRRKRKAIQVSANRGSTEPEKVTVLLFDTSGSMNGDPAEFQSALIGAFIGRAGSDLSKSGKQRHKVLLVPFNNEVGTPIRVTSQEEAWAAIRQYTQATRNTGGGTNIQAALIQALALIADAQRRNGEPLAAANVVLMSDGQSGVDLGAIRRARSAIDRRTPVQTWFGAISETNPDLVRFAQESEAMGMANSFYMEFPPEVIRDTIARSRTVNYDKLRQEGRTFYTEKTARQIPTEFFDSMREAAKAAEPFVGQIDRHRKNVIPPHEHLESLLKLSWTTLPNGQPRPDEVARPLENWLVQTRQLLALRAFSPPKRQKPLALTEAVVDDLVQHWYQLTGVPDDQLSAREMGHCQHLLCEAGMLDADHYKGR